MTMNLEKNAEIERDWLEVESYQFKILIMIACLAQEKKAFRGTLSDMRKFLGISKGGSANARIKTAINTLVKREKIKVLVEDDIWTLTLSTKAERDSKVIKIKNAYINAIQNYKTESEDAVAWDTVLKVLIFLWTDTKEIRRYSEIAKLLSIGEHTVKRAVKALTTIYFDNLIIEKKLAWYKDFNGEWKVVGNKYSVGYDFS